MIILIILSIFHLLIYPADQRISKMPDCSRIKKWWRRHIVAPDPFK